MKFSIFTAEKAPFLLHGQNFLVFYNSLIMLGLSLSGHTIVNVTHVTGLDFFKR